MKAITHRVTCEQVSAIRHILSVSAVARAAGVNPASLWTRLRRHTPLTDEEATRVGAVLAAMFQQLKGAVTVDKLKSQSSLLSLHGLAKSSGLNASSFWTKLSRGTPLSVEESKALGRTLRAARRAAGL